MPRVQIIDEKFAASAQSAEGTEAAPATADILPFIEAAIEENVENLFRADKGFGRSELGLVRGGNRSAQWSLAMHLLLDVAAAPVTAPPADTLLRAALGATPVSINTTVNDAAAAAADFDVTSATGIQVGDILSVNIGGTFQMRPVSAIAGVNLTFSPAFTAAPANGAVVKARIYRLAAAPVYLTLVNWILDTAAAETNYSRKAIDALVGEMVVDFNASIIGINFSGPAAKFFESDLEGTGIPLLPSLPTFDELAQARNFGGFWWNAVAFTAYELQLTLNNGSALLPVAFGSQNADGAVHGKRSVRFNALVDGRTENETLRVDARNRTERALFFHSGDGAGKLFGVNCRKAVLAIDTHEKGAETLRVRFADSGAFASAAENELVIAIG